MAKTDPIDPNVPAGSEDPKLGDNRIRELARAVAEILNIDHYIGSDSGSGYTEDAAGEHKRVKFNAPLASDPTNEANKGFLYTKDVSGKVELFWEDEDGDVIQLTDGGVFNVALLTSKTITTPTLTSPVLNTGLSGTAFLDEDNMASNSATKAASQQSIKAYIDSQIALHVLGAITNQDDESNTLLVSHAYLANQDGTVYVVCNASTGAAMNSQGYVDSDSDPVSGGTKIADMRRGYVIENDDMSYNFDVASGEYWEIRVSNCTAAIYWRSKGGTLVKCTDQD